MCKHCRSAIDFQSPEGIPKSLRHQTLPKLLHSVLHELALPRQATPTPRRHPQHLLLRCDIRHPRAAQGLGVHKPARRDLLHALRTQLLAPLLPAPAPCKGVSVPARPAAARRARQAALLTGLLRRLGHRGR